MKTQAEIKAIISRSTRNDLGSQPRGRYSWCQEHNVAIGAAHARASLEEMLDLAQHHQQNWVVVKAVMARAGGRDFYDSTAVIKQSFVRRYRAAMGDNDIPEWFECELYV